MRTSEDLLSTRPDLLVAFREGQREAMKAVFEAYEPLVRNIARTGFQGFSGFRSICDVDDAVSATFVAAFEPRARLSYDGLSPYHSYLAGIARNTMRSQLRKLGREVPSTLDVGQESLPDEAPGPEEELDRETRSLLIPRFKEHLREPVLVSVCEQALAHGRSEQDVADRLGMTRHQVRKALATVRKRIESFLRQEGLR